MELSKTYSLQFWLLCLSSLLFFASFNLVITELNNVITHLGGAEYKGWVIGAFTLAAFISRPFSGKLTDTIGRIPVIFGGTIVCIVMGVIYPFIGVVWGFLLIRFLHGFSTGFQPTGTTAYLADVVPVHKRGEAMGFLGVSGSLGMALGPWLGGEISFHFGTDVMFYCSSAMALLSMACLYGIHETHPEAKKFKWEYLAVWKYKMIDKAVFPAALLMLLSAYIFGMFLVIMPDYAPWVGVEKSGTIFLVFTLSNLATRLAGGKISDKIGRLPVIITAMVLVISGLLVLAIREDSIALFIGVILIGLGGGINTPSIFAWTIDLGNEKNRAVGIATVFMGLEAGIFSGSVFSGWIYANNPAQFSNVFIGSAIVAFVCLICAIYFKLKKLEFKAS